MHTACVWSEKLPFAGYSVVKELRSRFGFELAGLACRAQRRNSLARGLPSRSAESLIEREAGGEYRARTGDLLVANQALSQLS